MNLHAIASPYIAAVNPPLVVSVRISTSSTTGPGGKRVPVYALPRTMRAQIQAMTSGDLRQVQGLNLNGEKLAAYITGNWDGVSRPDKRGGDLVTLPDKSVWLVAMVLENWTRMDNWCKVALVEQNGA